jgi:Flp pilus assembly protein CpaB
MVLLGVAFFIVGLAAVYIVSSDDDDGGGGDDGGVTVVVANQTISAGTLASDLIEDGALEEVEVASGQALPDAARSLEQIRGARFILGFAKDQQVTLAGVQPLTSNVTVPEGFEAVAVQLEFVSGGAGYVTVNDRINLYAVTEDSTGAGGKPVPRAELLLTDVRILDINLDIPARTATAAREGSSTAPSRAGGDPITYLLALRTADVEKVIFQSSFESLYATLTAEDAGPSGDTPGQDGGTILNGAPSGSGG